MKRKIIFGFAVVATFLLVSTCFVSVVSAKNVLRTNDAGDNQAKNVFEAYNAGDKKIGDLVKELADYGPIRGAVIIVLGDLDDRDMKIEYLRSISGVVLEGSMKSTFQELVDEIYSTYREEFNNFGDGTSDGPEHPENLPDHLESDDVAIQDVFEFTFIKPKTRVKNLLSTPLLNGILSKLLHKIPILRNMLNKGKVNVEETNTFNSLSAGDLVPLYHKGSSDPIISGPIYKINAFLLFLEATIKDLSSNDFDLDEYCNGLNAACDIRLDKNIQKMVQTIGTDLELESRIKNLLLLPVDQRSVAFDEIINDVKNHELYKGEFGIESKIVNKFGDDPDNPQPSLILGIPIAVILWYIACLCFGIGLGMVTWNLANFGDIFMGLMIISFAILLVIVGVFAFIFI